MLAFPALDDEGWSTFREHTTIISRSVKGGLCLYAKHKATRRHLREHQDISVPVTAQCLLSTACRHRHRTVAHHHRRLQLHRKDAGKNFILIFQVQIIIYRQLASHCKQFFASFHRLLSKIAGLLTSRGWLAGVAWWCIWAQFGYYRTCRIVRKSGR